MVWYVFLRPRRPELDGQDPFQICGVLCQTRKTPTLDKNKQSHRPLLTFDIPHTALVATLDTYDFSKPGHAKQKRGNVSTLLSELDNMYDVKNALSDYQIFQKITKIPTLITREKMSLLMELKKFDPEDPKVVSIFSKFYYEDIELVIFLIKNNRTVDIKWHNGLQTCVSREKNDLPAGICIG
jgi:hypothetical protein